jgi:hypothetical protein
MEYLVQYAGSETLWGRRKGVSVNSTKIEAHNYIDALIKGSQILGLQPKDRISVQRISPRLFMPTIYTLTKHGAYYWSRSSRVEPVLLMF